MNDTQQNHHPRGGATVEQIEWTMMQRDRRSNRHAAVVCLVIFAASCLWILAGMAWEGFVWHTD